MAYTYTPRQLKAWPSRAAAAALWEQVQHLQQQADYWKHRAETTERRMHDLVDANGDPEEPLPSIQPESE